MRQGKLQKIELDVMINMTLKNIRGLKFNDENWSNKNVAFTYIAVALLKVHILKQKNNSKLIGAFGGNLTFTFNSQHFQFLFLFFSQILHLIQEKRKLNTCNKKKNE